MQQAIAHSSDRFFDSYSTAELSQLTILRSEDFESDVFPVLFERTASVIYNDRIQQTVLINTKDLKQYTLVTGLVEFCRGSELQVTFEKTSRSLIVDIELRNAHLLKNLLFEVHQRFLQEQEFRKRLKKQIEFEEEYRKASSLVYGD